MSWDVALVKIRGGIRPVVEVETDDYVSLGEPDSVRAAINAALAGTEWSTPDAAVYTGPAFEMEFDLESLVSGNTVLLHVHGSGDPFPSLMKLANANGWLAVDCATGEFLDPHNPSTEGWDGYKSVVDLAREEDGERQGD